MRANQINIGARAFTLVAVGAPLVWIGDGQLLLALGVMGLVWLLASLAERRLGLAPVAPLVEAGAVGLVAGVSIGRSELLLFALALPPFVAAVHRGLRGALLALSAELATTVTTALLVVGRLSEDTSFAIFNWSMVGAGLGLIGTFVHGTLSHERDELTPYLDAQHLIRQLLDLSDDLRSGLDVTSLAGSVVSDVDDRVPTATLGVYVCRGEALVPLVTKTLDDDRGLEDAERLAAESRDRAEPVVEGTTFALPLGDSSVAAGVLSPGTASDVAEIERTTRRLQQDLRVKGVQLDTALLFSDFRDSASADVRTRLAREMHDGVAQDIASLGYLVDALAARPASDQQSEQFAMLRDRITRIVAEVRQSVLTLRTSIGESESLGVAIGAVARHLSESSQIPIQVTLDEHSTRLRPEVEAELFRIAQEAMNNAIKHAQCTSIEVNCRVHAPSALITVVDDGRGLQQGRSDSHGLKIMRERARLVGADLAIDNHPAGGLAVSVRIDNRNGSSP